MTILQRFTAMGLAIFDSWVNMLKGASFDGFTLWNLFIVMFFITLVGIIWGFDLD